MSEEQRGKETTIIGLDSSVQYRWSVCAVRRVGFLDSAGKDDGWRCCFFFGGLDSSAGRGGLRSPTFFASNTRPTNLAEHAPRETNPESDDDDDDHDDGSTERSSRVRGRRPWTHEGERSRYK